MRLVEQGFDFVLSDLSGNPFAGCPFVTKRLAYPLQKVVVGLAQRLVRTIRTQVADCFAQRREQAALESPGEVDLALLTVVVYPDGLAL